ncbi:MAG: DNA translocase FtsK 4TM domain-containing protein [Actinomycetes bacterium]
MAATGVTGGLSQAFEGHGHDVWGILAIVAGVVAGLGIYADTAGPVGRGLGEGIGVAVGLAAWIIPPALVVLGVTLIRGSGIHGDETEPRSSTRPARSSAGAGSTGEDVNADDLGSSSVARMIVGAALMIVALCGLLQLFRGQPNWGDSVSDFVRAGGGLGTLIGGSLEQLVGIWGATLILLALGIVGVLVLTRTSVRSAAGQTAAGVRPLTGAVSRIFAPLFEIGDATAVAGVEPELAPVADPKPKRSRSRAKSADASLEVGADGLAVVVAGESEAAPAEAATDDADPDAAAETPDESANSVEQLAIGLGPAAERSPWKLPSLKLLRRAEVQEVDRRAVEDRGRALETSLAAHGVETRLVGMVVGPTVTRYELELGEGVKVAKVTSLHKDIAYAMASPDVRILAPIPGRHAIGVEVPNSKREVVALGDILGSEEARQAHHPLEVAVGRDINGRSVMANLATMPHVLIAGATGAGKSSCINSLITSVLMRSTPDQVRMILIDPKRVELGQYNKLPHLLTQVVTNPKKAANALAWAVREMERRYDLLSEVGVRDITGYNAAFDRGDLSAAGSDEGVDYQRLPFILIVVDELNDLMMVAARDVEDSICRIAQMARAVGIHLVIATQRPSVNVITGVIKANVPARWAFSVSSLADSRVILDQSGAERLVGKGDMLLLGPASSIPQRIQGCWVDEKEVRAIVGSWLRQAPDVAYVEGVEGSADGSASGSSTLFGGSTGNDDDDELLAQAMELVVRSQLGSTSMLQRKLRVGFARAGRLMDLLEQRGVVGPGEGSKARTVLMTPEELEGGAEIGTSDTGELHEAF